MKKLPTAVGCVLLLALASAPAAGQVLDGPEGPVEFLGLERWGAQELFDTIQERDPARPFSACAAVMRFELGFADAGAFSYRNVGSSEVYTVVVGVEDSARVRFRPAGSETVALPDAWVVLKAVAAEDPRALDAAARTLHLKGRLNRMLDRVGRFFGGMDAGYEGAKQVVDFVERADGDRDRRLALEVLCEGLVDGGKGGRDARARQLSPRRRRLAQPGGLGHRSGCAGRRHGPCHAETPGQSGSGARRLVGGPGRALFRLCGHESVRVRECAAHPGRHPRRPRVRTGACAR